MNRTKYDGKLTDALIQTVIDAENRLNGLESNDVPYTKSDAVPQIDAQVGTNGTVEQLFGQSARPTPTEQAEAWRRSHYDEEGEE